MPLPDTQDIYKPILETLRDEAPHNLAINDLIDITAKYFGLGELSAIDRNLFKQRITHAKKEMIQKKFLTNPADNMYIITSAGLNYLDTPEESESEIKPEAVIPEESEHEEHKEIPDEVPEVIESETETESEPEEHEEIQTKPEYEGIEPKEDDKQEKFEDIAELPELEDVPEIPDDEEEIPEVHEVNDESEDIKLEDEPEILPTESETESEPEPEETIDETSGDGIIMEDETETEQYETPSEGEDIAELPEPEPELQPEEPYESENMNEEMNMNPSTGIEDAIRTYNEELAGKVLSGISELPAEMFEVFVIDMLSKMGYRAFHNARYTSEETGSDLIHGVIIDDKTGAPIYIHARKLSPNKTIGRADMQDFIDALSDKGGKGVFATTGKFSEQSEVLANDERIMLIDGLRLAGLMISHNFCVKVEKVYEIKDFDAESFKDYKK